MLNRAMSYSEDRDFDSRVARVTTAGLQPISHMRNLRITDHSSGLSWRGLHMELGTADGWNSEDLTVDGHFVSMNCTDRPLVLDIRDEETGCRQRHALRPGSFWIHPEGRPFSLHLADRAEWSAAIVDGDFLDETLGWHHELTGGCNLVDPLLEAVFRALMEELRNPSPHRAVAQSLIGSFVTALGVRHGFRAIETAPHSSIEPAAIAELVDWLEQHLDCSLTVGMMAERFVLSTPHFSRAFKRATGRGPWEFVIDMRLARARRMLSEGVSIAGVAVECGFFDQAHLSRTFKRRFGLSPSKFVREPALLRP